MTRLLLLALLCVGIVLGVGLLVQDRLFGTPPPPVEAAPPKQEIVSKRAPTRQDARVTAVSGAVEVYHPKEGRWRSLSAGEILGDDAVLRTGEGVVSLAIGSGIEVEITANSQFRLKELTTELSKVALEQGLVTANVAGKGDEELSVSVAGSDVEARARDGKFSVLRDQQGQVTVAGQRGNVSVAASGTKVVVEDGHQSTVAPGSIPSQPIRIPGELFVKLIRGQGRKLRFRSTVVEGETSPGAVVVINGVEAGTKDGRFAATVPLNEGSNTVTVVSHDVLGRQTKRVLSGIEVDSRPPTAEGRVSW